MDVILLFMGSADTGKLPGVDVNDRTQLTISVERRCPAVNRVRTAFIVRISPDPSAAGVVVAPKTATPALAIAPVAVTPKPRAVPRRTSVRRLNVAAIVDIFSPVICGTFLLSVIACVPWYYLSAAVLIVAARSTRLRVSLSPVRGAKPGNDPTISWSWPGAEWGAAGNRLVSC